MIACVDVAYREDRVVAACVGFLSWTDPTACHEQVVVSSGPPAPYAPGEFFRRELPYLLALLSPLRGDLSAAVVDGYVWLGPGRSGLGAHLSAALSGLPVIGVAKSSFAGAASIAIPVVRGRSSRSLFVTAIGLDPMLAASHIASMHGPHRIPTLLKRVDTLAREA